MRIGVFGGTFDPLHIAHLILADEAYLTLQLTQILFVLTPVPPHKQDRDITPVNYRLEMLQKTLQMDTRFEVSDVDINRPPPHYAVDTLKLLHKKYPEDKMVYLMGSDSLRDLPNWFKPKEFVAVCDEIGIMCRPNTQFDLHELCSSIPGLDQKAHFMDVPFLEISSSLIRKKISSGAPYQYYVPPEVRQIIEKNQLYWK